MKKTVLMLTISAFVLFSMGAALADEAAETRVEPELDGKTLYKTLCKVCHGAESEAGEYTPMFLIQEQWEVFFDEDYAETHKGLTFGDEKKTEVLKAITPEMLKLIRTFCNDGAADSEHPMTCG